MGIEGGEEVDVLIKPCPYCNTSHSPLRACPQIRPIKIAGVIKRREGKAKLTIDGGSTYTEVEFPLTEKAPGGGQMPFLKRKQTVH